MRYNLLINGKEADCMNYTIENVCGHYEVYDEMGSFLFSADTRAEIMEELY